MPTLKRADIILGADISGTSTTIGFFRRGERKPIRTYSFRTALIHPHTALKEALTSYIASHKKPKAACCAIAGPLSGASIKLSNAPWTISKATTRRVIGCKTTFINDFEAQAYGLDMLGPHDCVKIRPGTKKTDKTRVILGAGTGLGCALMLPDTETPLTTEAGHWLLDARTSEEHDILQHLQRRLRRPVEYEDVLSGRGLEALYRYHYQGYQTTAAMRIVGRAKDKAAAIAQHRTHDPLCKKSFRLFLRFYARFIRNLMVTFLPYGGVYVSGGIARKNADAFTTPAFRKMLKEECGRIAPWLRKVPIRLVIDSDIGMKGAAYNAQE